MGFFITFEGIEGCGKSTQVRLLAEALNLEGFPCIATREPGGTHIGSKIREILLNPDHKGIAPQTELLLYAADRAQHIIELIKPALNDGKVVICDRFTDATVAYQGFGRRLDSSLINRLNEIASQGLRPGLTVLLDCPVKIGIQRALERNSKNRDVKDDRFEQEAMEFHDMVRNGYLAIAKEEPERIKVVDAARDIQSMHGEIRGIVDAFLRNNRT